MIRPLLVTMLLAGPAVAQDVPADTTPMRPLSEQFPVGETLMFEGKFGILKLGRATMEVLPVDTVRGQPAYHFRFLLDASLMGLISLHDQFDSWVELDGFASLRFRQRFDEAGRRRTADYEIFPDSGIYWQEGIDTARTASPDPLDDTAFFYFVRTLDLEPGERYELNRYFRPDRNPVIIEVMERDTVDVPAGRFNTIVIHPIIKGGGIFKESSQAQMWITDDDRRLIVQMKTRFPFGWVTLRLTGSEGVRPATPDDGVG